MNRLFVMALAAGIAVTAPPVLAQETPRKATPFVPLVDEPAVVLHVWQPLAEPLAKRGTAVIPYSIDNLRILPIVGAAAASVSPRAGHIHVTVDELPWHWADAGGTETIVVAGLPAGKHKILIEVATPEHRVLTGQTIAFDVPAFTTADHTGHAGH